MKRSRPITLLGGAAAIAAVSIGIAACGGGSSGSSGSASGGNGYGNVSSASAGANKPAPASSASAAVDVRTTDLGKILVDSKGRSLYLFEKDTSPASTCYGACTGIWPPLTVSGSPKAGAGLSAAKLGTSKRKDGPAEVTYNGHPLYYYAADTAPGQTTGEGLTDFGGGWDVVAPSGNKIEGGE